MYNEFRFAVGNVCFTILASNTKSAVEKAREAWKSEYGSICVDLGDQHPLYDLEILIDEEDITIDNILLRDRLKPEHILELSNLYGPENLEEWEKRAREFIASYMEE